ncbi:MAG: HPr family phosphocarrier protein [bacterium]|nr:HPr family phosphocarrier protein [bacterium]
MVESRILVNNRLGLHARAAAQLVRLTAKFKSSVTIFRADRNVFANAKSILSVLALAASKGTELSITVDGEDEEAALNEIEGLFANGFGESL